MIKKTFILTILFIGAFSYISFGQESAQATMRVSVTVLSGSSVDTEKPEMVYLSKDKESDLGMLSFKGMNEGDFFISNTEEITLTNKNGNKVKMNINSRPNKKEDTSNIQFDGTSEEEMMSSVYRGELTTSIEYF